MSVNGKPLRKLDWPRARHPRERPGLSERPEDPHACAAAARTDPAERVANPNKEILEMEAAPTGRRASPSGWHRLLPRNRNEELQLLGPGASLLPGAAWMTIPAPVLASFRSRGLVTFAAAAIR